MIITGVPGGGKGRATAGPPGGGGPTHGDLFTINGTGFGSKGGPDANKPVLWAPMDGSINPSSLGLITSWSTTQRVVYSETDGQGGQSTGAAVDNGRDAEDDFGTTLAIDTSGLSTHLNSDGQKSFWFRKIYKNFSTTSHANWKDFRSYPGGADNYPNTYFSPSNGIVYTETMNVGTARFFMNSAAAFNGVSAYKTEWSVLTAQSSGGADDAHWDYYVDGAEVFGFNPATEVFSMRNGSGDNADLMDVIYLLHAVGTGQNDPLTDRYFSDDIYFDFTHARVIMHDAATLAGSTEWEIQIPTAWSDTSVTVQVNQGSMAAGTKYMTVIDASDSEVSTTQVEIS